MTAAVSIAQSGVNNVTMRNRIINGAFEFWQRGNTSRTFAGAASYSADRWTRMGYQDGAHERVAISSAVAGMTSRYAIRVSSATTGEAAGGSRVDLSQKIESANCFDLAGQTITISFWIRFSAATINSSTGTAFGNFNCFCKYNTTTTDSTTFSDLGDGTINNYQFTNGSFPTTWTKVTITGACPSGLKNLAMRYQFEGLGNTASAGSAWYEVAEVQLEKGTTATPFEQRLYGTELALCQRYYQVNGRSFGVAISSNAVLVNQQCTPTMRATPSVALTTNSPYIENAPWASIATTSGCTADNGHMTVYGGDIKITGTISGIASNQAIEFGGGQLLFSAEL